MRRCLALVLSACLAALTLLTLTPSTGGAEATTTISGRLVDGYAPGNPAVAGVTVELVEWLDGVPGAGVGTATTAADGSFSLVPEGSSATRFYVRAAAGDYQFGWVGRSVDGSRWLERDFAFARSFVLGTVLGDVKAIPAFIRGVVVNSVTKKPVAGVVVTARSQDKIKEIDGVDRTNRDGVFRINGITCEDDCYLKLNGSEKGYETGFRDCDARVVPTWGGACASDIGRIGRVFLDRL